MAERSWTPRAQVQEETAPQQQPEATQEETAAPQKEEGKIMEAAAQGNRAYAIIGKDTKEMMEGNEELSSAVNRLHVIAKSIAKDLNANDVSMDNPAMIVNAREGDDNKTFLNISIKTDDGYALLNANHDGTRLTSAKAQGVKAEETVDFLTANSYLASQDLKSFVQEANDFASESGNKIQNKDGKEVNEVYVNLGANKQGKQCAIVDSHSSVRFEVGEFQNDKGKTCQYARAIDFENKNENGRPSVTYIKSAEDMKQFEGRIPEAAAFIVKEYKGLNEQEQTKEQPKEHSGKPKQAEVER